MRIKLYLFLWLSVAASGMCAQSAKFHGTVYHLHTREPLPGVEVRLGPNTGANTDAAGRYKFSLAPGRYEITYRLFGFHAQAREEVLGPDTDLEINIFLAPEEQELEPVVISAGRFEQKLSEVTVSMEVLKPDLVQNRNTTSIDQILQQTPGVVIVDSEPQIRSGSGYSFGAGSRVQVLVDGLPMLSGDAGKPSWGFLPIENLEQIEIIKGASSVLYGSSALSGVINMRTAYPRSKPQTRITVFHGTYSGPQSDSARYWSHTPMQSGVNFFHSRQLNQWDLVLGGNFMGNDGALGPIVDSTGSFPDHPYNPFKVDRYESDLKGRLNAGVRYRFANTPGLSAGLNTNWSKNESLSALLWENSGAGLYKAFSGSATRTRQTQGTVDPFVLYHTPRGYRHSLRMRWATLDNDNDNNQGNFSDVYYGEYQFQLHFDSLGIEHMVLTAGAANTLTNARGELFTGGNADGRNTASNHALFAQVDKQFFQRLNVSAGVRYERFYINAQKASKPVFRSGVNYRAAESTYLRASFGQGYRFPSIAEKFIVTDVGALRIFPNPDIEPETSYNAEIGLKHGFRFSGVNALIDAAFFYQHFNHFIEFTFGQWATPAALSIEALQRSIGFKSLNTGEAAVSGAELSVSAMGHIQNVELTVLAGYTYTRPVSLTPDLVYAVSPVDPQHPLSADNFDTLSYRLTSSDAHNNLLKYRMQHLVRADVQARWKRWMAGWSLRTNSHMQNIDLIFEQLETYYPSVFNTGLLNWRSRHTGGDYVMDVRLSYSFSRNHRMALVVNNLLNREYAIRPLAIEDPRTTVIQYTFSINQP